MIIIGTTVQVYFVTKIHTKSIIFSVYEELRTNKNYFSNRNSHFVFKNKEDNFLNVEVNTFYNIN